MTENNRPVSYQQTLGTKTEQIKSDTKADKPSHQNAGNNLEKADANFPE